MSDLLNQASLVMVPSGYKEDTVYSVVPTDGSGDLSFTRASNGTRINSAGLVEVCPWNLFQQSETFDNATWQKSGIAVTANSAANPLTGLTNADNLVAENVTNFHYIYQPITYTTDTYTIFVYLKANGYNWFVIDSGLSNKYSYFNLSTGVLGTAGSGATASIESVGNGWYKCGLTYAGVASSAGIYLSVRNADNGGSFTGNGTGGVLAYGAQLNIGSTAKPYFPTTDRLNVPRLTYQNGGGGCPSLLLEKQSTNLVSYSEQFDNASWTKQNTTVTANAITSPDGTTNAQKIVPNTTNGTHYIEQFVTISAVDYTYTIYAKKGEYNYLYVNAYSNSSRRTWFNLNSGTVSFNTSPNIATIESVGNGWYRCTITNTSSGTTGAFQFGADPNNGTSNATPSFSGDGTSGIYVWGAQHEASSYKTSYIPTTSSSATRVADACFKTGISSLIGQTEGVWFLDFVYVYNGATYQSFMIDDGITGGDAIYMYSSGGNTFNFYVKAVLIGTYSIANNTRYKIAFAYKSGQHAVYINGQSVATSSNSTTTSAMSALRCSYTNGSEQLQCPINQICLFPTRLTNSELAQLTTI